MSAAVTQVTARPVWTAPASVTAALILATAYTVVRNPHEPGAFPACVFYAGTGAYCPGCGGLRAVHDLLTGDILGAIEMNAVVVFGVVPAVIAVMVWWWRVALKGERWVPEVPQWLALGVPALLGVFWVVRNLPGFEFLRP